MSSDSTADALGKWRWYDDCGCGTTYYYSERIAHEQVPCYNALARGLWNVVRVGAAAVTLGASTQIKGGLASAHHHYVDVKYKCESCGRCFRKTYELRGSGSKLNRKGYYYDVDKVHSSSARRVSYEKIEAVFDGMWYGYSAVNHNCITWATDFYPKAISA